jgi:epoxyqueuosine reductase
MTLEQDIKEKALKIGFMACGITDPSPVPHATEFHRWLADGFSGNMRYMNRQAKKRADPGLIAPEAQSVIVILDNYYYPTTDEAVVPKVAKYAKGTDYHIATRKRIDILADWLTGKGAKMARSYVDAGPVPERELAQRAGLGWIGKNTMLINPGLGSFFFIGAIFTDLALLTDQSFQYDRCGSCTRCLDACPTDAFVEERVLDATKCISYLTIEHRGPISPPLAAEFEGWGFGCDICNDVCPWNVRFAQPSSHQEFLAREVWETPDRAGVFEGMDEATFQRLFGDTPMERPGLEGMRRNWQAALQGGGGPDLADTGD